MPIATLAPELLSQCLGNLSREDLARASLVCRGWLEPSRDHYWSSTGVNIMDESAKLLAPVLAEGTMVPRKIKGIQIDESDDFEYREAEDTATWQTHLGSIMEHFSAVSELTVGCLDLSQFPAERRTQILRPGQVQKVLIIQWLKVEHEREAASFVLNQPNINFLGIGAVLLAQNEKKKDDKDENEENHKDENSKMNENDSASIVSPPSPPDYVVRLNKLRHLVLFSGTGGLVWSHIVPSLAKGMLMELKTLIANCHDRDAFAKLIGAAAPALRSLAVSFNGPGIDIDVSNAKSLSNLSISLANYPGREHVLADTVATISSAPPSLENVFLNIGPGTIEKDKQLDSASLQWATLDAVLAGMPLLRSITIILVFDSCISMVLSMPGGAGGFVEKWKNQALDYIKTRLPGCDAKGIIEVKNVTGSWTNGAFADHPLPE